MQPKLKGRYLVVAWATVFLAATGMIVVRQSRAHKVQTRINRLQETRDELREARSDLQSRITALKNREVLGPKVAALGLRVPSDSEQVDLRIGPER
jgi:cell division protein FtsL